MTKPTLAVPEPAPATSDRVRLNAPLDETFTLDVGPGLDVGKLADDVPPAPPNDTPPSARPPFAFAGADGDGFGDANDPTLGGVFVSADE